ncbi:MAG: prephenate dehydrogenase/arogenate dehydrogenase family protein [Chloroflexi bacterium]|nr:prephenate dehydrogenase/arogenate dehydrogenase family protein [Chloroflexota bacterium]
MKRIVIIGTGLIGSSLGLALKQAQVKEVEIMGYDRELSASSKALKRGAIDKVARNLKAAVAEASMVILATPVMAIKELLSQIGPELSQNCVVTDAASTKVQVMSWAEEHLPQGVSFVGGHPMAGKETSGVNNAEADLFSGRIYCLTPGKTATPEAVETVVGLVGQVKARPFFIDAAEHDGLVGAVSHLPIVLSAALVSMATSSPSWQEMAKLAASGFRDLSRLASGDPDMNRDICLTNSENLARWINIYIQHLLHYQELILAGSEGLGKEFQKVQLLREKWLIQPEGPWDEKTSPELPGAFQALESMLIGERLAERSRQIAERLEDRAKGSPS